MRRVRRRHVLLGSAALVACKMPRGCGKKPSLPPGMIVGQIERVGHLLRQLREAPVWNPDAAIEPHRVIVVGAGVAGLACARALRRAGLNDVLVLELDERAGGTASWGENATSAYPWGAHYVTLPLDGTGAFAEFLIQSGACIRGSQGELVGTERALCREPEERLFLDGVWHEGLWPVHGASPQELEEFARFRSKISAIVAERRPDGTRLFRFPMGGGALGPVGSALDQMSVDAWLAAEGLQSRRLAWMMNYACRDDYGTVAAETSALAGLAYFAGRLRAAGAEPQPVLTWPEGNGHLVQALAEGVEIRTGVLVTAVHADGRVSAVDAQGRNMQFASDAAVVAVPSFVAARIVREEPEAVHQARASLSYAPWWVANLTLREHPESSDRAEGAPIAWDNVIYASVSVGYVVATHAAGADSGRTVLTYYMPMAEGDPVLRRKDLLNASYEQLAEQCLQDLEQAHPRIRELVEHIEIRKWGHAMVRPVPGLLSSNALALLQSKHGKIFFAHTDLAGLALFDEAFAQGERAATEVRVSLERP